MDVAADRYEGQFAGTCGCGAALTWMRDSSGNWVVAHEVACVSRVA